MKLTGGSRWNRRVATNIHLDQGPLRISHEQEDKTNGAYEKRSLGGYKSVRDDAIRDGRFLDTPHKSGNECGFDNF